MSNSSGFAGGLHVLPPLAAHLVSASTALREELGKVAASAAAGPIDFSFSVPDDGIEPLLEPGIDALIIDIGDGGPVALGFLRRVIALGPNAPVIAIGADDAALQAEVIGAGAEDCLSTDTDEPRAVGLAIRRAVARRIMREDGASEPVPTPQAGPHVTLVQETPEAIVILDSQGTVRFANGAAQELLGRGSELVGQPFGLPSEPGEHDITIRRPDGDNRFAEMRIVDTRWGGVPARVAALNDVTVRRKLEETMQAVEARSQETRKRSQSFFSNVNHDLRTPLTHIIGFSEMMKNERLGPMGTDRYKEYASDIYSSGTMLLDMIEDLLGIAEAEMDQIDLTDEICNLGQLAEIAVASQRQNAAIEGVTIEVSCPERLPGFRGDARRLRQGLFRLLAEAVHTAHRGSTIRLSVAEEDGGIAVTLDEIRTHTDALMEQDAFPYIVGTDDPFVSAEDSSAPREESLALSLTRKVMELHGGRLNIMRAERGQPGHRPEIGMKISVHFPSERVIR
ncbi:PAS/PAC sensor signal transduction histidine kinase [Parvibaculum lavamentivorans DS-1]|uniref:histidine kinase n=1 Tax=Parvibaculum lavamentivorans (strain DS-1 / DSM 13023 / NCIMB 13966) TaxID=402881 RepID=A7HQN7_PARL1|nr:histidine kinase dimerization/phospho-acceptor domain-containing protein [Parvibaculum lavamentivorans]ABS62220.1 PAS/PAC sensor signal transduction histidine kinase [Parvibaculum lavamentivorans DS-1]